VAPEVEDGTRMSMYPEPVEKAAETLDDLEDLDVIDAQEWILADDATIQEQDVVPTTIRLMMARGVVSWKVRPLSDVEIRECNRVAQGNRNQMRALQRGAISDVFDQTRYQRLLVALATVEPNLEQAGTAKGVNPEQIIEHRFRYKSGLVQAIAETILDISGFDSTKVDVVARAVKNS
jgi:hypothetical protein